MSTPAVGANSVAHQLINAIDAASRGDTETVVTIATRLATTSPYDALHLAIGMAGGIVAMTRRVAPGIADRWLRGMHTVANATIPTQRTGDGR